MKQNWQVRALPGYINSEWAEISRPASLQEVTHHFFPDVSFHDKPLRIVVLLAQALKRNRSLFLNVFRNFFFIGAFDRSWYNYGIYNGI